MMILWLFLLCVIAFLILLFYVYELGLLKKQIFNIDD